MFIFFKKERSCLFFGNMHKRQKIETSDIVVSCTFVSPHQIDQRGQFYLLKFEDGVLRLLTPHWDFLSNPVDEAYVKQHMPVASNIVVKPGFAFINFVKLANLKRIVPVATFNSILFCIIESNKQYTKENLIVWLMKGIPFSILVPFIRELQIILPDEKQGMLDRLHFNSIYSEILFSTEHVIIALYAILRNCGNAPIVFKSRDWSIVKAVLIWKGMLKDKTCLLLNDMYNFELKGILLLLLARKNKHYLFGPLPVDLIKYILVPLICWSLPIQIPLLQ